MLTNCVKVISPFSNVHCSLIASVGQAVGVGQLLVAETSSIKTLLMQPVNFQYDSSVLFQMLLNIREQIDVFNLASS